MPSFWSRNGRHTRRTERQGRRCRSILWRRKWRRCFWKRRENWRPWRNDASRNSALISNGDYSGTGLQRGRPVPLFLFFRQDRDCRFSFSQGRKPRLSLRSRDNSVREPNAQPAPATGLFKGFGVLPQQAETAISGNAGNRSFEHLWEQMHCLPSSVPLQNPPPLHLCS